MTHLLSVPSSRKPRRIAAAHVEQEDDPGSYQVPGRYQGRSFVAYRAALLRGSTVSGMQTERHVLRTFPSGDSNSTHSPLVLAGCFSGNNRTRQVWAYCSHPTRSGNAWTAAHDDHGSNGTPA